MEVQYQHDFTYAEAFNNERIGWTMGPKAFVSQKELIKTMLHERYRNVFDPKTNLSGDAAKKATKSTFDFESEPYKEIKMNPWLLVAKKLELKEKDIECPFCKAEKLTITFVDRPDGFKKDVYVFCPNCNSNTVFSGVLNWVITF